MRPLSATTDIHSALIGVLREYPDSDLKVLLRESIGGSEENVKRSIAAQTRLEYGQSGTVQIPIPAMLTAPDERAFWRAAALEVAALDPQPAFEHALPGLVEKYDAIAREAAEQLPEMQQRRDEIAVELEIKQQELGEYHGDPSHDRSSRMKPMLWKANAVRWLLWLSEGFGLLGTSLQLFGVTEYASLADVPAGTWSAVISLWVFAVFAIFGITHLIRWAQSR